MQKTKRLFLLISMAGLLLPVFFVVAGNPASPISPSDNIQDPGDASTPWGGCGPSDSNCYVTVSSATFFAQNGNSYSATATLGTNDSNNLVLETANTPALTVNTSQEVLIGSSTDQGSYKLQVTGNSYISGTITAGSGNEVVTLSTGKIDADAITLPTALNGRTGSSSASGLTTYNDGLSLLQGCNDSELLKWIESTDTWDCATDTVGVSDADYGDVTVSASGSAWAIDANAVTNAKLRQSVGLSIIGRSANTTGNVADITGTDGQVLRVSGTSLGFGTIPNASLDNSSITVSAGTSGSDFNVSGSPVSLGGTVTLNIPDAGSSARGLVTTGTQTFAGSKTFSGNLTASSEVYIATTADLGTFSLQVENGAVFNLGNTNDFVVQDNSTAIVTFADTGAITFAPTSGQSLLTTIAGAGTITDTISGSGNYIVNLSSTGDFVFQDNGSTFITISDTGGFDITLDATDNPSYSITNAGSSNVTTNLTGTGDFIVQDNGSTVFTISDAGAFTFAPTSGQSLTANFAGTGFLDVNPATYTNNTGAIDLVRTGNFTGTAGETAIDLNISPSLTYTEPGSGTFTWHGIDIDMSAIAVTAGAGTSALNGLRIAGTSDADAGTVRGLLIDTLTGTASTETAITINTGWDTAISSAGNYVQSAGTMSVTSANTTQTTTSSAFALNVNSLTSGTGFYAASSTLSSGSLIDLAVSGTAAASNTQKALNVSTSGANATSTQTTYGGYFSNTHTGTSSTNVALFATASGGTNNYAAVFSAGNVGVQNSAPAVILHVGSTSVTDATTLIRTEDANSSCNITAQATSPTCGSDITLKKDIESLDSKDLLEKISNLNPVSFHWNSESSSDPLQYGFIAQEVEEYFPDLVTTNTWIDGTDRKFLAMGGLMPYVVGAVKGLNIKVSGIESLDETNNSFISNIKVWLSNTANGIEELVAGKIRARNEICVGNTCINEAQLIELMNNSGINTSQNTDSNSDNEQTHIVENDESNLEANDSTPNEEGKTSDVVNTEEENQQEQNASEPRESIIIENEEAVN